ncbi:hypothetical protein, partial [Isoptericola sp. QY 916]|uniref:hypothetical protein n=1 Tax=Isoptericola sp. QY 916 TaxID=2782570 RepID=UPI003D2FD6AC|nr:hypothetical protein [Isoptericola sp. QY 916]
MPIEVPEPLAVVRARAAELARERTRLVAEASGRLRFADLAAVDRRVADVLATLADPLDAAPDVPLVLLPVRVETKLRGQVLRVRVAPDTIHVDSLVRSLSDGEVDAGRAYWSALWDAPEDPAPWVGLLAAAGPRRAAWVAEATTPTNLAGRDQGPPQFPATPAEVTRGTVARCLPDRFVVRVQPRGGAAITRTGAPVPRDVPLAPVVLRETDDAVLLPSGLRVPAGSEWVVDFDAAVRIGLGVEVPLPAGSTFVDHVVVAGVRGSVSEADNAAELADLLRSHRFSEGLDLLAAGTPTNNADAERSPYRPSVPQPAPPVVPPAAASADAEQLASFLGLDATAVDRLLPAGPRSTLDLAERAANTALWFVTWEGALGRFLEAGVPGVSAGVVEAARRLHRDHVRGAGPAPALRVGNQPYGVLPVARLAGWEPRDGETTHPLVATVARALDFHADGALAPRVRP